MTGYRLERSCIKSFYVLSNIELNFIPLFRQRVGRGGYIIMWREVQHLKKLLHLWYYWAVPYWTARCAYRFVQQCQEIWSQGQSKLEAELRPLKNTKALSVKLQWSRGQIRMELKSQSRKFSSLLSYAGYLEKIHPYSLSPKKAFIFSIIYSSDQKSFSYLFRGNCALSAWIDWQGIYENLYYSTKRI